MKVRSLFRVLSAWTIVACCCLQTTAVEAQCRTRCGGCVSDGCSPGCTPGGAPAKPYSPSETIMGNEPSENAQAPTPGDQQFNLGEAAPAQSGNMLAMADMPNIIGDFFGTTQSIIIDVGGNNAPVPLPGGGGAGGGVVGRQKIIENSSPLPRDRVFFNYSYFHNVQFGPINTDVNRYVPGFEKTFFDGMTSVEFRAPFASTLDSDISSSAPTGNSTQFGNLTIYGKLLLMQEQTFAMSAGLGVAVPTAPDITLTDGFGTRLVEITNQSTHLLPFIGAVYAPDDRFFTQGLLQIDIDANGSAVDIADTAGTLTSAGVITDTTFLFASASVGYWHHRGGRNDRLSGLASIFELHYNKSLSDFDVVTANGFQVGSPGTNFEMINLVGGLNFEFYRMSTITAAYVVPVTTGPDRVFDGELRLFFNRYF